jgi:hypothetical protein
MKNADVGSREEAVTAGKSAASSAAVGRIDQNF